MYGVTPCHAGSGSALGVVDLPIQRERHTNWPVIQSSGMKGALRANFDRCKEVKLEKENIPEFDQLTKKIFGTDKGADENSGWAGAISVSDGKILAFPMRSSVAPFVWITCPAVLKRLNRDLLLTGAAGAAVDALSKADALSKVEGTVKDGTALCVTGGITGKTLLEDSEVDVRPADEHVKALAPLWNYFEGAERLLIVSDGIFDYGVSECTQIVAQISINQEKGITKDGSLRYQEELPADTLMYCVIQWWDSRGDDALKAETIRTYVKDQVLSGHIQAGGDETLGRGIFRLAWK
jgi:CRISPR-associated protein Cmr4